MARYVNVESEPVDLSPYLLIEDVVSDVHVNSIFIDESNNLNLSYTDARDVSVISLAKYVNVESEPVDLSPYLPIEDVVSDVHLNSIYIDETNDLNLSYTDARDDLVISLVRYVNVESEPVELSPY